MYIPKVGGPILGSYTVYVITKKIVHVTDIHIFRVIYFFVTVCFMLILLSLLAPRRKGTGIGLVPYSDTDSMYSTTYTGYG